MSRVLAALAVALLLSVGMALVAANAAGEHVSRQNRDALQTQQRVEKHRLQKAKKLFKHRRLKQKQFIKRERAHS